MEAIHSSPSPKVSAEQYVIEHLSVSLHTKSGHVTSSRHCGALYRGSSIYLYGEPPMNMICDDVSHGPLQITRKHCSVAGLQFTCVRNRKSRSKKNCLYLKLTTAEIIMKTLMRMILLFLSMQ